MVFNATGMTFDWNGYGNTGDHNGRQFTDDMENERDQTGTLHGGDNGVNGLG